MPTDPNASDVTRRRFLAVAGSAVASSVVLANAGETAEALPLPTNPNTYTITVHADVPNKKLKYEAKDANGKVQADPLYVDVGDSVIWVVKSHGQKHNATISFKQGTTPFNQADFDWNEQDEASASGKNSGTIKVGDDICYPYSIAVFDPDLNLVYVDDPTIIVGGDGIEASAKIMHARTELEAVTSKIQSIEKTLTKAVDQLNKKSRK